MEFIRILMCACCQIKHILWEEATIQFQGLVFVGADLCVCPPRCPPLVNGCSG